jgi:hypothetical protein
MKWAAFACAALIAGCANSPPVDNRSAPGTGQLRSGGRASIETIRVRSLTVTGATWAARLQLGRWWNCRRMTRPPWLGSSAVSTVTPRWCAITTPTGAARAPVDPSRFVPAREHPAPEHVPAPLRSS